MRKSRCKYNDIHEKNVNVNTISLDFPFVDGGIGSWLLVIVIITEEITKRTTWKRLFWWSVDWVK